MINMSAEEIFEEIRQLVGKWEDEEVNRPNLDPRFVSGFEQGKLECMLELAKLLGKIDSDYADEE